MQTHSEIKRFVQETLGCSCPEHVFDDIDYQKEGEGIAGNKVCVGDRLLIYIISFNRNASIEELVQSALQQGVDERDKRGLNRFRLVLVAPRPEELRSEAEGAFDLSVYKDDKTHLHLVSESELGTF